MAKYHLGKTVRLKPKQPAVSPLMVHDLQGGPQGICRAPMLYCITCAGQLAVLCRSFELLLMNLWGFLLFLLPPSCFAGFSVIFFSVTVLVSGSFLGWFPLLGLPYIHPAYDIWLPANLYHFPNSSICDESNCS